MASPDEIELQERLSLSPDHARANPNTERNTSGQTKCFRARHDLILIIEDMIGFLRRKDMDANIIDELNEEYKFTFGDHKDVFAMWEHQKSRLREKPRVVVAGDMSSGKTSLINALVGEDILPSAFLANTTAICRINNSIQKAIRWNACAHGVLDETTTAEDVKEIIRSHMKTNPHDEIQLSWPISFLEDSLELVDTPGLGHTKESTELTVKSALEATSVIYVLNTGNAGGVHYDRIGLLWQQNNTFIDPIPALFIANKWDQVPKEESNSVKKEIAERIQDIFPKYNTSDLVQVSLRQVDQQPLFTEIETLKDKVRNLSLLGVSTDVENHTRKVTEVLQSLQAALVSRVRNFHKPLEKLKQLKDAKVSLRCLENDTDELLNDAKKALDTKRDQIIKQVLDSLSSENWPDEGPESEVLTRIAAAIRKKIRECLVNSPVDFTEVFGKVCNLLSEKIPEIRELIGVHKLPYECKIFSSTLSGFLFLFLVPFLGALHIQILKYIHNKKGLPMSMKQYTANVVSMYGRQTTNRDVDMHFAPAYDKLYQFKKVIVQSKIKATYKLISHLKKEIKKFEVVKIRDPHAANVERNKYNSLLGSCKQLIGKLRLASIQLSQNPLEELEERSKWTLIARGSCGKVFRSKTLPDSNLPKDVALKVVVLFDSISRAGQLGEYCKLRALQHTNLIKCYGAAFEDDPTEYTAGTLYVIMELCCTTLEKATLEDRQRIPGKHAPGSKERNSAFQTYKDFAQQISEGLKFLHECLYAHRDIKLENILLTEGSIVKVADFGSTARQGDITNTTTGTPIYLAPEVFKQEPYTAAVDIYAFGICLWEMWYGRHAYLGNEAWTWQSTVEGVRPKFEADHKPTSHIQDFVSSCWHGDSDQRPDADECLRKIEHFTD